ncbi:MAG: metal-dependent hydrolase [Methanoregula sp.]
MFLFAHLVSGLLLGLGFCCLTHDRRTIPLCIVASLIPDLIDKPLTLISPALCSGRTIFHALFIILILAIIALVMVRNRYLLYVIAVACCIFVHQLLDTMWLLPSTWAYPLFGPFPLVTPPDYAGVYLWIELTTPSEWIFLLVIVVIMFRLFSTGQDIPDNMHPFWTGTIVLLASMGILMTGAGIFGAYNTFFAPTYTAVTTGIAGILALAGAAVMVQWHRLTPYCRK